MDILSYLSELIQTRKAVGVSGLGTVYKKKLPGRYDAGTHSFVPPSYTIDFTPEVKEEIILAEFISKKRNVSIDTANYFIDEFSTGILQQLNNQQHADFGELGKLYKADDEFRFEPAEKLNYGFDFYGLPVVKADQEPSAEEIMPETPSVEENQSNSEEEAIPVVEEIAPEEEEDEAPAKDVSAAFEEETPVIPAEEEDQAFAEEITVTSEEETPATSEEALPFETPVVPDQIETPEEEEVTPAEEEEKAPAEEIPVIVPVETVVPHMEEPAIPEEEITPVQEVPPVQEEKLITPAEVPVTHTEEPVTSSEAKTAPPVTPVQEPIIETVVPHQENFIPDSQGQPRKDEKQLRAEIEALNFYRSKSPVAKATISEQEEVIWNIKDNTKTTEPAPFYNKNEEIYNPEEEEEQPKTTPLYLKIILGLLILVIMMIVAYIVKPEWFSGILANSPFATPKTEEPVKRPIQERYKSDSITAPADTTKTTTTVTPSATATAKKDSVLKKAAVPARDTAVVYEIIGASMHDQKEADRFIELMKRSGITAKVVTNMSGKRLKMSIATLKDEESAKLELEKLSKKLKIPGIYIYKNKQ